MFLDIMDLLCSEPSPTSPAEKFFESEQKLPLQGETAMAPAVVSGGNKVSGHLHGVSHKSSLDSHPITSQTYDMLSSSPLSSLSDASSGYESMITSSPSSQTEVDNEFLLSNELNFHSFIESTQSEVYSTCSKLDPHMLDDLRIPRQLLCIEDRYVAWNVDELVYQCSRHEIDEKSRRVLTEWMLEVSGGGVNLLLFPFYACLRVVALWYIHKNSNLYT